MTLARTSLWPPVWFGARSAPVSWCPANGGDDQHKIYKQTNTQKQYKYSVNIDTHNTILGSSVLISSVYFIEYLIFINITEYSEN